MTAKDRLRSLIEALNENQATEALELLATRYGKATGERPLPAFVGMGHSGRCDLGCRAKDILRNQLNGRTD